MTEPRRKCEIIAVGLGFRHRTECLHRNVELEIRMNEGRNNAPPLVAWNLSVVGFTDDSCVLVSSCCASRHATVWPIQRMSDNVAYAVARRLSCLLVVLGVAFATSSTEGRNRNLNRQHIHPSRRKTSPRSRPIGTVQIEAVFVSCVVSALACASMYSWREFNK